MIVIMAGLPGTGKSALASKLAKDLKGTVISKDIVRHTLFEKRDVEYSAEQDDFCMGIMLQTAAYLLRKTPQRFIFLDGRTFSRRYQLQRVIEFAGDLQQPWKVLECKCSDTTAERRLFQHKGQNLHAAMNRTFDLYLQVKDRFEEITTPKTVIDTDLPLNKSVNEALRAITSSS